VYVFSSFSPTQAMEQIEINNSIDSQPAGVDHSVQLQAHQGSESIPDEDTSCDHHAITTYTTPGSSL
jgi:hypothetical protein